MSNLIVAGMVIGSVVLICFLLVTIHNKQYRSAMNELLKQFSKIGSDHQLSFSSQELLHNSVLGLDGVHRKILVVTRENENYHPSVIDLDQVKNCTVKKTYGKINAGDLKKHGLEQHIERIALHFDFINNTSSEVGFYRSLEGPAHEAPAMERKAKHWEAILSKMLKPQRSGTIRA